MKVLFSILLFISFTLFGQSGLVTNINTNQGLPTLTVYSIFYDSEGQMWLCTDKGISIYNGKTMVNYGVNNGLPDNEVFSVFEDSKKRIWPCTLKGEVFYILNNKIYTKKNDTSLAKLNAIINHENNNYINNIFQINKDTLYFCSSFKGIYKFFGNGQSSKINTAEKYNRVTRVFAFDNKLYWFTEKGICEVYSNRVVTPFKLNHYFETRFATSKNEIYFLYKNVIYKLNGTKLELILSTNLSEQITSFKFLTPDIIIFCSQQNLYTYSLSNKKTSHVKSFPNTCLSDIIIDNESNCWLSSLDKGVFLINNLAYKFYESNSENTISEIIQYKNLLFLGYNNGTLNQLDLTSNKITSIPIPVDKQNPFQSQQIRSMAIEDSTYLWIGYNYQTIKYNLKTKKIKQISFSVKNIETDAEKKTWATVFGGIVSTSELEKEGYVSKTFKDPSLVNYRFYGFCHDSLLNQYYISRDNFLITYKNKIIKSDTLATRISEIKTKNYKLFWILNQDKGLTIYDRKKLTFIPIHTADNIPTTCNDFCLVNDSTLWVAYNTGYSKLEINTKTLQVKKQIPYELITNTTQTSINKIIYKNGIIYLATQHDLISIKETDLQTHPYNVPILITNILINGKPVALKNQYKLNATETDIDIQYIGLYYQKFGHINYRYKFAGNDTNWRYTTSTDLEFPNLAPGSYKLTLNAADQYENWSDKYASISFLIKEPFYKTYLFATVMFGVLTGLSVFLFNSISSQKLKRKRRELELKNQIIEAEQKAFMAQVNPHFVFNAINSIQHYILKQKPKEAYNYLGKFSLLMRNVLMQSKTQLIRLQQDYDNLKIYLELEVLRFDHKLNFEITIQEDINMSKMIPPMLIQPYVENSIWHGIMPKPLGGIIKVDYSKSNGFLFITITDNGIGREAAKSIKSVKTSTGSGLVIAERRLKLYSEKKGKFCKIEFVDLYDAEKKPLGTQVILTIPI